MILFNTELDRASEMINLLQSSYLDCNQHTLTSDMISSENINDIIKNENYKLENGQKLAVNAKNVFSR